MTPKIFLASGSRYRRELLSRLGLPFEVRSPDIDESPLADERFIETATRLAKQKAVAIARQEPSAIVIGSDQVACCGPIRLDKPGNADTALAQLQTQRGKTSEFHTAICVVAQAGNVVFSDLVTTRVRFRAADELTDERLRRYIEREQPFDCAGAAKSEGLGITLMASFDGDDPTALIGLPLIALTRLLQQVGVDPLAPPPMAG
jgi:septum formation protein